MLGKTTASLSSGLLARKGHARPAMRPQGFVSIAPNGHDDLGWNDMGEDSAPPHAPHPVAVVEPVQAEPAPPPPVLQQRAELAEQIAPKPVPAPVPEPEPEPAPEPVVTASTLDRVAHEATARAKAAFTLRLDPDRHLRLRLASAVRHHSAQQLVTEALDAYLDSLPDVDALARQLAARESSGE